MRIFFLKKNGRWDWTVDLSPPTVKTCTNTNRNEHIGHLLLLLLDLIGQRCDPKKPKKKMFKSTLTDERVLCVHIHLELQ